jgi:hypothetical protein
MIYAIRMFWQRSIDCFSDPIRWRHFVWRWVEGYVGGVAVLLLCWAEFGIAPQGCWQWAGIVSVPSGAPLAEYLVYEYLIEPWARWRVHHGKPSTAGPYFERGPRDGERFIHE